MPEKGGATTTDGACERVMAQLRPVGNCTVLTLRSAVFWLITNHNGFFGFLNVKSEWLDFAMNVWHSIVLKWLLMIFIISILFQIVFNAYFNK